MNQPLSAAQAGTLESSDLFIRIVPLEGTEIEITLESSVEEIYGDAIKSVILETVRAMNVEGVSLIVHDKGALDYVIKARVQTAILRALGQAAPDWSLV